MSAARNNSAPTSGTTRTGRGSSLDAAVSNTDIVLLVAADLGGGERAVDIEDIAEAAWKAAPARFSWPRHQQYPDLDAVDVTLRAAKKNEGLVTGSKRDGWMLTVAGTVHLETREDTVRAYLAQRGHAGRTANRRERGGADSATVRLLASLDRSPAVDKYRRGVLNDEATVHDFLAFYEINQYMPVAKYRKNRQRVLNLVRDDAELRAVADALDAQFGATYKEILLQGGAQHG